MNFDETHQFLIVDDMYTRYTIIVGLFDRKTSIYCEECEQWVGEYEGDKLSQYEKHDFLEFIIGEHDEQVNGTFVEFE